MFKRVENRFKDNPLMHLLYFMPASIISSIIGIPLGLISLPFSIFGLAVQRFVMQILLTLQNIVAMSFWYFAAEFSPFKFDLFNFNFPMWIEIQLTFSAVYFGWFKTINSNVNETITKYFSN